MDGSKKYIETIKTVLIVALFISTMLLLYFFWENPARSSFPFSEMMAGEDEFVPSMEQILQPSEISVDFGRGVATVIAYNTTDSWTQGLLALRKFANAEDLLVESITKEQYDKIMQFRSISFSFLNTIPFSSFCEEFGYEKSPSLQQIWGFSRLSYSAGSPESLFITDSFSDKYYRLVSPATTHTLEALINATEQEQYVAYYSIGTFLGTGTRTLMPLAYNTKMEELFYNKEFQRSQETQIRGFAQKFFGESFDFVRRIEESKGTLIYMYGYGQKVLTVYEDGHIEYKEEVSGQGTEQDYFEALHSALNFVASHGGWQPFGEERSLQPCLRYSREINSDKKKGYQFFFGVKAAGEELYYEGRQPLMVEIMDGQVTFYQRDLILPEYSEESSSARTRETFSPVNMLAQNYSYLYKLLLSQGYSFKQAEGDALFDEVSDLIDQVKQGYVLQASDHEGSGAVLKPAWIIVVDDMEIYFDLFDASPLGHTKIAEK